MGRDKALVEIAGRSSAAWVAGALGTVTEEAVVIGREGTLAGLACVADDHGYSRGPLAGLATGLRIAAGRSVLLVAVDQPWLRAETLRRLVDLAGPEEAVVPLEEDARQVTCAVYPAAWAKEAAGEYAAGGSIQTLLDRLAFHPVEETVWRGWGEDGRSWYSVDTPADLADGLRRYGAPTDRGINPPPPRRPRSRRPGSPP